jgi:hypothetical protein
MSSNDLRENVKTKLKEIICAEHFSCSEAKLAQFAGGDDNFESITFKQLNIDAVGLYNLIFGLEYSFDLASLEDSELDRIFNKPDATLGDLIDMLAKSVTTLEPGRSDPQFSVNVGNIAATGSVGKIASNQR